MKKYLLLGITLLLLITQTFAFNYESNLPIIIIDTNGKYVIDEPKIPANMKIIMPNETIEFDGFIGIEFRGASSQMFPKKSYGIETWDENEEGIDISILGYNKEEDWVLAAPYNDKGLIRNNLGYEIWRGTGNYSVAKGTWAEVFVNDTRTNDYNLDQYMGLFAFGEKIKRGKNRVNISKLKEDCVTGDCLSGGYLIRIDAASHDDNYFMSTLSKKPIIIEYPKSNKINNEQYTYIKNYYTEFEASFENGNFRDYLDENSFVDYFLMSELVKHVEGYSFNFYMYKDNGGKLFAGPAWDFDQAFGNSSSFFSWTSNGWQIDSYANIYRHEPPFWWKEMLNDKLFQNKVVDRWKELRKSEWSDQKLMEFIDSEVKEIGDSQKRNFERWNILQTRLGSNPLVKDFPKTFEEEINYLKNWLKERSNWIDTHIDSFNAKCGNGIIEEGEDCEGSEFCLPNWCICDQGFIAKNGQCEPTASDFSCTPPTTNAIICEGDDVGITLQQRSYLEIDSSECDAFRKCQFYCEEGYERKSSECVNIYTQRKGDTVHDNNLESQRELSNKLTERKIQNIKTNNFREDFGLIIFLIITFIILLFTPHNKKM